MILSDVFRLLGGAALVTAAAIDAMGDVVAEIEKEKKRQAKKASAVDDFLRSFAPKDKK